MSFLLIIELDSSTLFRKKVMQVDFDYNNHLIVDCSHQCNLTI